MKKTILGVLVLVVVVIGGGLFYVINNLDSIVEQLIETAGTQAVGSPVTVGSVSIDLTGGSASIMDFAIANPQGFSDASMISFDELSVALDLPNLSGSLVAINSIVARNPRVFYETIENGSNFETVAARFSSGETEAAAEPEETSSVQLQIGSILIEDIEAGMKTYLLPNTFQANLGEIRLQNLSGTPEEIAADILQPVLGQLGRTAGSALLNASAELLQQDLQAVGQQAVDQAQDRLEDATENVREGLGNLLQRN